MLIKDGTVSVKWIGKIKKYYVDKGYVFTKMGNMFDVKIEDLVIHSREYVNVKCDCEDCENPYLRISMQGYTRSVRENDIFYCKKCGIRLFGSEKTRKIKLDRSGSIAETHPELVKYFLNKDDSINYSAYSNIKVDMICPDCGLIKKDTKICDLTRHGRFSCLRCGDKIPYPEKFFHSVLQQLNIDFQTQLTKKTFGWCDKYKYDFYISSLNIVCETHGLQHYEKSHGYWQTSEEIQENDKLKYDLAIQNGIKEENYIVIDCRKSELEFIKNSILKSELPSLLNFKEEDIDWLKCHEYACNNLVKEACELWNSGIENTIKIGDKLKLSSVTIITYLKQGSELGWCIYDAQEEIRKSYKKMHEINSKMVICLNTNEVFNSMSEAGRKCGIDNSSISACCLGKRKSAGKHPVTNEPLIWMYFEEYKLNLVEAI